MLYVTKQNEYLIRAFMRNHITKQPLAAGPSGCPRLAAKQLSCWQQAAPNKHSANSVGKALIRKAIIIGVIALNYPPNRERRSEPGTQLPRPGPCTEPQPALCCPLAASTHPRLLTASGPCAKPDARAPPGARPTARTPGWAEVQPTRGSEPRQRSLLDSGFLLAFGLAPPGSGPIATITLFKPKVEGQGQIVMQE